MTNNLDPASAYFGRDLEAMSFAKNYHRWVVDTFRPYAGKRLIEVGAGSGNFTEFLLDTLAPSEVVALEPSENMFPLLKERWAQNPAVRPFRGCLADWLPHAREKADTICYVNVIEHIEDDGGEMDLAREALAPGGHLLIFVPALAWLFGTADKAFGHFRRYSRKGLSELVAARGFEIRQCHYMDIAGVLPWWISFVLLRRKTLSPGMVRIYDRFVVPFMRRVEKVITPPLGKNLLLAARKV